MGDTNTNPLSLHMREEILNIAIHGFGLFLSLVGFGIIISLATLQNNLLHIVSGSIYAVSLILLYTASVLFHTSLASNLKLKKALEVFDHCAIYLLIAGSYTPFLAVSLQGSSQSWVMLSIIWGLAFSGIVYKIFFFYKSELLSTLAYVLMGWLMVFAFQPLLEQIGWEGFLLLLIGGLLYTFGAIFYVWDHKFPFAHGIWHSCVLMASIFHYVAIVLYVMLPTAVV